MLLQTNTERVIDLIKKFDRLNNVDKIRLAIHILEHNYFNNELDTDNIINLLKEILGELDPGYKKVLVNFSRYTTVMLMSGRYLEFSDIEKQKFSIEMLFNIYETDFKDEDINNKINRNLDVYNYAYSLNI